MRIPLMDLARQFESIEKPLQAAVYEVLKRGQYIMGPNVQALEAEYAAYVGVKHAVAVGNGTDALQIALRSLGIGPGDEVITCAMSFFATAEAISAVGATPVFVDCTADTYVIDPAQIEARITARTKAVIVVHLYGQCADMDRIVAIARRRGLYVVEDAAQASGAQYKGRRAGALGDIACFSFFPTKNLGCAGDGGMITTDDDGLARMCRAYRVHGSGPDGQFTRGRLSGEPAEDVEFGDHPPKYFNFVIGCNSRLDEIQAAILRVKLPFLEDWNARRARLAAYYSAQIKHPDVRPPRADARGKHIYYVYVIQTPRRDRLRAELAAAGIASGVYFPVPLHLQPVYRDLGYAAGDLPNAERVAANSLALPMFAELTRAEQDEVVAIVNSGA